MYSFSKLLTIINMNPSTITFYGYRKAKPEASIMDFDRYDRNVEYLEKELFKLSGASLDNHVLFQVKISEEHSIVLYFSDTRMFLGMGVKEL